MNGIIVIGFDWADFENLRFLLQNNIRFNEHPEHNEDLARASFVNQFGRLPSNDELKVILQNVEAAAANLKNIYMKYFDKYGNIVDSLN